MTSSASQFDGPALLARLSAALEQTATQALAAHHELLALARTALNAAEAGILVPVDDQPDQLRFLASINSSPQITAKVLTMVIPCHESIAGYVYSMGLPVAYVHSPEDATSSPAQHYRQVDEATGLVTRYYLAAPMMRPEQILGVLTFVNRTGGEATPFSADDMRMAQQYAAVAASLVSFHRRVQWQKQASLAELEQMQASLMATAAGMPLSLDAAGDAAPPLARIVAQVEALSRSDQELCAELVQVVASHIRSDHDRQPGA